MVVWAIVSHYPLMTANAVVDPIEHETVEGTAGNNRFRTALKTPIVWLSGLFLLIYVGIEASVGNWAYTVQSVGRATPTWIAGYGVSGYWLGLTLGRLNMGQWVKRLGAVQTVNGSLILLVVGLLIWAVFAHPFLSLPLIGYALAAIFPTTIWLMP
jgi:fucose permease